MSWLRALYIGATIFGAGITLADLLGVFSHLLHGDGGGHDAVGHDTAHDVGHDAGGHDTAHDVTHDSHDGAHVAHPSPESTGSPVAHDLRMRGSGLVRAMTVLRSLIYFCLGFGPVGLFALTRYQSPLATLAWSVPLGAIVMLGTRALRSLAAREVSSDIASGELLMEPGVVTVTIGKDAMGKVRLTVEGRYVDYYARTRGGEELAVGTRIRVVEATEDCVYVDRA